jgi:putative ABC transport system substrate-binding protein
LSVVRDFETGGVLIFALTATDALFVGTDTYFSGRRVQLVNLAARHAIPTAFPNREAAEIGGLMSYGTNIADAWRQCGVHVGQILKGAKPADMPVIQARKFELVINAQTAKMLNVIVPDKLIALADEVIE